MAINLKSMIVDRTMLFPCAAGVQMPQIGAEDSKVKPVLGSKICKMLPMKLVSQDTAPVNEKYVKMVSTGLSFAEDVVEDRCLDMLPYDTKYFKGVFNPGELVSLPTRTSSVIGRHDKRGTDVRHMPCYLKKTIKPKQLVPLRKQAKEKALLLHKQALEAQQQEETKGKTRDTESHRGSFFMTQPDVRESEINHPVHNIGNQVHAPKVETKEVPAARKEYGGHKVTSPMKGKLALSESGDDAGERKTARDTVVDSKTPEYDWDDHLMSRLSKLTANWIVHQKMEVGERNKDKLTKTLQSWYGAPIHTDLVREETSDEDEEEAKKKEKKPKSKWKKKEAALLERVYNVTPPPVEALDPYSDDSKAPFYRQPAGIRKKKKNEEKEEAAIASSVNCGRNDEQRAINATAHNIEVKRRPDTPPLTVRDYLPPGIGDKVYQTDNRFQQEWLTGNNQIFHQDDGLIKMDSSNKYRKNMQREMPQQPKMWYELESNEKQEVKDGKISFKPHKGHRRWIGLPETVEDNVGMVNDVSSGFDPVFLKEPDAKQKRKIKQNKILGAIVHDWRNKWFLNGQFADATPDDLIRDMADIQPHVRLKAVGTVAKAAEYKPPTDSSIALDTYVHDPINDLPEQIFVALECLLDDNNDQVQKAAAITLYSLDRPSDKAKARLRGMLNAENNVDRWAGAQCLAHYGECDSDVVAEIIKQILDSESAIKHEQGMALLAKISNSSTLVHCMVAEQLNSSSWRYRVIACKILPTLFGSINRDITQKLSELMWHDWHVEVRKAAAQCLGKTSHGRDVHDDIRDRILNGTERTKMEAINKLGQLGIMTAKLLPAFLNCFTDSYVSIRCEVCITCGNLQIKEEQVLERLVHLATFDPIWKVKALAIQALGKIGEVNEEIKECLLWAMRYEEKPGVRAEACHSLIALNIDDEDVIEIIQDRLLVESNQLVREEMIEALSVFGYSTSDDMDTVAQIKAEVRKLCTRNIIASQIIVNENDETKREQLKRKVCQTEKDIETLNERKQTILRRIRSQARSSRASNKDSLSSSPPPRTSTPLLPTVKIGGSESSMTTPEPISREGTVFTPTADKELEAILNQDEDLESVTESMSGKSRPMTDGSMGEFGAETPGENEKSEEKDDEHTGVVSKITVTKADDENDADGEEEKDDTTRLNTGKSSGKHNVQLSLPMSQAGLLSPMGSAADMKASRLTVMSRISGKRSIISRDSLREREKVNAEVNTIYADLNARYADMIQHLVKIDKGLNTKGSSAESSTVESLNVSNVGSSHIARLSHQEIIDTIKELENIQSARQEKGTEIDFGDYLENSHGEEQLQESDKETEGEETTGDETGDEVKAQEQDVEWKSFVDTLSQDNTEDVDDNETTYPYAEDTTAGMSMLTTTDENTARDDDDDDDDDNDELEE